MRTIRLQVHLRAALLLVILALLWGCGGGGGGAATPPPADIKSAALTVTQSGGGTFVIQGANLDGVAGMTLHVAYDGSSLGAPSVVQGSLIPGGAVFAANTATSGAIMIAFVGTTAVSGNGQVARVNFASYNGGTGNFSVTADMIDINGTSLGSLNATAGE